MDRILMWVIYLPRFTICYITQLTCIYSWCWKWCSFISVHLLTSFTMFLTTFLSVLSYFNHFHNNTFYWRLPSKFFKETLSTVGVRHPIWIAFQNKYKLFHCQTQNKSIKNGVVQTPALTDDWFNWYRWPRLVLPSPANSCTCSSIMSYQQNHYK
jgi:hypothetical protein